MRAVNIAVIATAALIDLFCIFSICKIGVRYKKQTKSLYKPRS